MLCLFLQKNKTFFFQVASSRDIKEKELKKRSSVKFKNFTKKVT